jgi:predicted Zn-dependent protease
MLEELSLEIARGLEELQVPGEPRPYFIAFKLTEVEVQDVAASLGATTASRRRHFMGLDSHVRVGDYQVDNSNFLIPREDEIDGSFTIQLPLEATTKIARKAAWLATDAAYKEALQQLTAKKAALERTPGGRAATPSYSQQPPIAMMDPVPVAPLETLPVLEARAREVSASLRDHAHVRESRVAFTSFLERRWYLNSEGTRAHDVRRVTGVILVATAQAEDGEILSLYRAHYGHTMADLPDVDALRAEATELADLLEKLRTAPYLGNYTGPVLFEGAGAAGIVRATLAPHLSGTPVPIGLSAGDAARFGGAFADRLGLRVVAPILTVTDDPTARFADNRTIIGGYKFDDEGTKAQAVDIIRDGTLTTLLMSRTPSVQIAESNGHARRPGPGIFHGSTTNLLVSGKDPLAPAKLRKALLDEAAAQGLDHAVVIRGLDDIAVTANAEMSRLETVAALQTLDPDAPPPALLAYRIHRDGREELVRGVQLKPMPTRSWKDVIAVGKRRTVFNYLAASDDGALLRLRGGGEGFVPSAGVESAIATPDLLFRELEIAAGAGYRPPPPAVAQPGAGTEPRGGTRAAGQAGVEGTRQDLDRVDVAHIDTACAAVERDAVFPPSVGIGVLADDEGELTVAGAGSVFGHAAQRGDAGVGAKVDAERAAGGSGGA